MSYVDGWIVYDNEINAIINALKGTGSLAGLAVAEQAVPAMGVTVATGGACILDKYIEKTSTTNVTIAAADGTHPRKDLVCMKYDETIVSSDADASCKGTAAAAAPGGETGPTTTSPKPPNIPADYILLAEVWVAAGVAQIFDADISDKRIYTRPNNVIAVHNTEYSWALLDAEQGVATDGTVLFVTDDDNLSRWTKAGARTHNVDADHGDGDAPHTGDCTYYNNSVYVVCTNYPVSDVRRIYKYAAADLAYEDQWDIVANPASGVETSSVAWDPVSGRFWIASFEQSPVDKIYKYTTAFVYDSVTIDLPSTNVQGITFTPRGQLLVSGTYNLYECSALNKSKDDEAAHVIRGQEVTGHEGLDLDPDGKALYLAKAHSGGADPLMELYYIP